MNDDTDTDGPAPEAEEVAPPPAAQAPAPLASGRFATYKLPSGDLRLVYRLDGTEADERQDIPAWAVSMMQRMSAGEDPGPIPGVPKWMMRAATKMGARHG